MSTGRRGICHSLKRYAVGSPEIYIYIAEPTGDKRATLAAFSANRKKSLRNAVWGTKSFGFNDYLAVPVTRENLLARIEEKLRRDTTSCG